MSEEKKCKQDNELLNMICKVEEVYRNNFNAQAELFKKFFDSLEYDSNKIVELVSKSARDSRIKVLNKTLKNHKYDDVLFLGIPSLDARILNDKQKKIINELFNMMKNNNILEELKNSKIKVNAITTTILFLFFPEKFIPIAGPIPTLLCNLGINITNPSSWDEYKGVLSDLKEKCTECCRDSEDFKQS